MKITINSKTDNISIVAVSVGGWGRGKTLPEALKNMRAASRGMVDDDYGMTLHPKGKRVKYDFAECLEGQRIGLWMTNDDTVTIECYMFRPSPGKWAIFLGDEFNNIVPYMEKKVVE